MRPEYYMSTELKYHSFHPQVSCTIARPIEHQCGTSSPSCQTAVWKMRTTDTSLWMSFDFPSVPIPRAQSKFYSSDHNLFPIVNPPSSTQGKNNKQTKLENLYLYTVVKWLKYIYIYKANIQALKTVCSVLLHEVDIPGFER